MLRHLCLALLVAGQLPAPAREPAIPKDLENYLNRPEAESRWKLLSKTSLGNCDYWHIQLQSQTWQDLPWQHDLVVFRPSGAPKTDKMLLISEGGSFRPEKALYGATLATLVNAPVALLLGVPNQPLLGGKSEDHLIAETFVRYLDTGDNRWPLLFPMVKSAVKAMDAIGEFTAREWETPTAGFIVSGASKRGWTAWLAAAADPRVIAIAPMVIDLLNIPGQLPLQLDRFGSPSQSISPYTERGLVPLQDTDEARALWKMVDPWTYRSKLTMPKLVVLANNDPYWTTDALNVYWDGLPGEKYISYTPNAGHDLMERDGNGRRGLPMRALNNIAAFVRSQVSGNPLPQISWEHQTTDDGGFRLVVNATPRADDITLWTATSHQKDFRKARWQPQPVKTGAGKQTVIDVPRPAEGYVAFYADLGYRFEDLPLRLSTQLRLEGAAE